MIKEGKRYRDKNAMKRKYAFHSKYFKYNSKRCSKCGKRRGNHHYLCNRCWNKRQKEERQ